MTFELDDTLRIKRETRLRRRILALADSAKAVGEIQGQTIFDLLVDLPDYATVPLESDEIVRLARDLVNLGLLNERDSRTMKHQRRGLAWMFYSITGKGTRLLARLEAKEPLVEDERI